MKQGEGLRCTGEAPIRLDALDDALYRPCPESSLADLLHRIDELQPLEGTRRAERRQPQVVVACPDFEPRP